MLPEPATQLGVVYIHTYIHNIKKIIAKGHPVKCLCKISYFESRLICRISGVFRRQSRFLKSSNFPNIQCFFYSEFWREQLQCNSKIIFFWQFSKWSHGAFQGQCSSTGSAECMWKRLWLPPNGHEWSRSTDVFLTWAKARPQHRELRALLFTKSVWFL